MSGYTGLHEVFRGMITKSRALEAQGRIAELRERSIIGARYSTNAGQNIADITTTVVNFEDVDFDVTIPAVTTGANWIFTAPVGGFYHVAALVTFAGSTAWAPTEHGRLMLYLNGSLHQYLARRDGLPAGSNVVMSLAGQGLIHLAKDDEIDVRVYQDTGGALALQADGSLNWVSIWRL